MNVETWLPVLATVVIIGVIVLVVKEGSGAGEQGNSETEATAEAPAPPVASPGANWQASGWGFAALGALGLIIGLFIGTSVQTSYSGGDVVNLDLMFSKGVTIGGSLFAIGLGVFCLGVGAIVKAIGCKA